MARPFEEERREGKGHRDPLSPLPWSPVLIFSRLWMASQQGCWEWPYRDRSYITRRQPFPFFPARLLSTLATPTLFSVTKFCHFRNVGLVGADGMWSFQFAHFPQCDSPRSHLVVAHVIFGLFFFFAVYYSTMWTACSLIVHPLKRTWVISTFGVFWINLLYTRMNILM